MLAKDTLGPFKRHLTDALRTTVQDDPGLLERFVELRPGTIDILRADVNHLLTGRRGVGKSTTFAILQQRAKQDGDTVIFVDVEQHKLRAYPDVLIEMIIEILGAVTPARRPLGKAKRARRQIRQLVDVLSYLRQAGPEVTQATDYKSTLTNTSSVELRGEVARSFVRLGASSGRKHEHNRTSGSSTTFTKRKEEFLRDLAGATARALDSAARSSKSGSLLVVLDDFYMIPTSEQPLVLDHLHGITKRTNVWLKVASVESRTQTFIDGDPPIGMQPPGDLSPYSLDVGLSDFYTATAFLEKVAVGVLAPHDLHFNSILTEKARERAVLVAGGAVCRDYFELLIAASDVAWNRVQGTGCADEQFRIHAEDILAAAGRFYAQKLTELRSDTGVDAPALEHRLHDILAFVNQRETFFVLVRQDQLEEPWAKEILQLSDLKFLHRIMTTRPNAPAWRGVDTVVFMVDIPALAKRRLRQAPIEFWKPGQSDRLRRARWIYTPTWQSVTGQGP